MSYNQEIVKFILNYIDSEDKSKWYVGIATDVKYRLFNEHNVDEKNGKWCFKRASSESEARDTEKYLLNMYSFQGGPGGGDKPEYVYAYKITSTTRQ